FGRHDDAGMNDSSIIMTLESQRGQEYTLFLWITLLPFMLAKVLWVPLGLTCAAHAAYNG
ncbi:MAG TPA: hypothetical protein VH540_17590, partial [Ktedonobacterales bacterium]